jgi:hypothetical protein
VRWPLLVGWVGVMACSDREVEIGRAPLRADSLSPAPPGYAETAELIPAEWTVFEDTSEAGDITTASLQLPASRTIQGLLPTDPPRLILRCMAGRLEVSIDTVSTGFAVWPDSVSVPTVPIQLDSAPVCE